MSYRNAWEIARDKFGKEIDEILDGTDKWFGAMQDTDFANLKGNPRRVFDNIMIEYGWTESERVRVRVEGSRRRLSVSGALKNGVNAQIPFGMFDFIGRWIFQQSPLAIRFGLIEMPIALIPTRRLSDSIGLGVALRGNLEFYKEQLLLLSPLSHQYPFLMLEFDHEEYCDGIEIFEVEAAPDSNAGNSIVNKCLEFPPEYQQAGLGIINYFGTYLRERYPSENAKIRIEQDGLKIIMTIISIDGKTETIQRALEEYDLIVSGKEHPSAFTKDEKLIMDLTTELRIAKLRVETQQDLLQYQGRQIDQFMQLMSAGLSRQANVNIDFRPNIQITSTNTNNPISETVQKIQDIIELIPSDTEAHTALDELSTSLQSIEDDQDYSAPKNVSILEKFRKILEKMAESGTAVHEVIAKTEGCISIAKELVIKYNQFADWAHLTKISERIFG